MFKLPSRRRNIGSRALLRAGALFALFAFASGAAAGDAATDADPAKAEAALRARIEAYWTARAAGDVKKAVSFYVPLENGEAPVDVPENGGFWFREFAVERIELRGDRANVGVRVKTPKVLPSAVHMDLLPESLKRPLLPEEWIRVDGEWRKVVPNRALSRLTGRPQPAPKAKE